MVDLEAEYGKLGFKNLKLVKFRLLTSGDAINMLLPERCPYCGSNILGYHGIEGTYDNGQPKEFALCSGCLKLLPGVRA